MLAPAKNIYLARRLPADIDTWLAIAIPGAPTGLGLVEAAIVGYLLSATNLNIVHAIAAAFAFHLISAIPQIAGAIVLIGMLQLRSVDKTAT